MLTTKGFTLIEIIVVLVIMGILSAVFIVNYNNLTMQAESGTAQNNLIGIYTAQNNYYANTGNYCLKNTAAKPPCAVLDANCGDTLSALNCNLGQSVTGTNFNFTDANFNYNCSQNGATPNSFLCTATFNSNNAATLSIQNIFNNNVGIILPSGGGANGCSAAAPGAAPCNPICTAGGIPNFCPN